MRDRTEPYNARQHTESSPLFGRSPVVSSDQNRTKRYQDKTNQDVHCTILAFTLIGSSPPWHEQPTLRTKPLTMSETTKAAAKKEGLDINSASPDELECFRE